MPQPDVVAPNRVLIAPKRLAQRAQDRWRALVSTPFRVGLAMLLSFTVFWRAYTSSSWSWFQDDWLFMAQTHSMGFWPYVFRNYNGHLAPGGLTSMWLATHFAPLDYTWVVGSVMVCAFLAVLVWALAFVEIFGEKFQLLIPLALLALSPLLLPISLFGSAGIQIFQFQLFMGLSVLFVSRWLRIHSRKQLVFLIISYAFGLFIGEKALLIVVPTVIVGFLITDGPLSQRIRKIFVPAAILAVMSGAYIVVYLLATQHPSGATGIESRLLLSRSVGDSLRFFLTGLLDMGLPTLAGGPWVGPSNPQAIYPELASSQWLLLLAVGLVLGATALEYRTHAFLAMAMTLLYAVFAWGLVLASSRYDDIGDVAVHNARYAADIVPVAALTLAYLLSPTRGQRTAGTAWKRPLPLQMTAHSRLIGAAILAALTFSTLYGNGLTWETIQPHSPKPWVTNLLNDSKTVGASSILNVHAPDNVSAAGFFGAYSQLSEMLKPLELPLTFDKPSARLLNVAGDGHIVESNIDNSAEIPSGPIKDCGYLVKPTERTFVPVSHRLFPWFWGVQIEYYSQRGGVMTVKTDTKAVNVPIPAELSQIQLTLTDSISAVGLNMMAGSGDVCVTKIVAGSLYASDRRAVPSAVGPR